MTASVPDTLRAVVGVLLPLVARGVIVRRQRVVALLERLDADRRLVGTLQRLRARYGPRPLLLRLPARRIVLVLWFWVGIAGVLASFVLTWLVSLLAAGTGLTMAFPPTMVLMVSAMLVLIALGSGFLSLGVLKKSQPADLLR